jgi:hypothetical protein
VINFSIISASRGASILRSIYPDARITVDSHANAVIVVASGYDEQGMRTIASGIDIKNPTDTTTDTYQLKVISPTTAADRLSGVFPSARVLVAPNRTIIIMASPSEMAQIKGIVTAIDTAPPTPTPKPRYPAEAVRVTQRNVKDIARAVAAVSPMVKVSVSGSEILLAGPQDEVDHAKLQWLGIGMELDESSDKNWYLGFGPQVGKSLTLLSGSLTNGFLFGGSRPNSGDTHAFLHGWTINGLGAVGPAYGLTFSPTGNSGRTWAFESGVGSPQVGISATYVIPISLRY